MNNNEHLRGSKQIIIRSSSSSRLKTRRNLTNYNNKKVKFKLNIIK